MDVKRVLDEALRLPVDARAALAGELLASLDGADADPDREAAWAAEIRQRLAAYEDGSATAVPADEFLSRLGEVVRGEAP